MPGEEPTSDSKIYTLSELAAFAGARPRTLQFWTSNGLIKPLKDTAMGGPGVHRRYPRSEAEIALLLTYVNAYNLQVGILREFSDWLRDMYSAGPDFRVKTIDEARALLDEVLAFEKARPAMPSDTSKLRPSKPVLGRLINSPEARSRLWGWIYLEGSRTCQLEGVITIRPPSREGGRFEFLVQEGLFSKKPRQPFDLLAMVDDPCFIVLDLLKIFDKIRD